MELGGIIAFRRKGGSEGANLCEERVNRENLENVAFRGESFKEGLVYNVRCQREVK